MTSNKVDFPDPFGPTTNFCPSERLKSKPSISIFPRRASSTVSLPRRSFYSSRRIRLSLRSVFPRLRASAISVVRVVVVPVLIPAALPTYWRQKFSSSSSIGFVLVVVSKFLLLPSSLLLLFLVASKNSLFVSLVCAATKTTSLREEKERTRAYLLSEKCPLQECVGFFLV